MKSRVITAAILAAAFLLLTGCGAAKKAQQTEKSPVETFVMPGNEYLSGGGVIRAMGIGRSDNESVARKKAMAEASAELAAALQRVVSFRSFCLRYSRWVGRPALISFGSADADLHLH